MTAILQSLVFASVGFLVDSAAAPWNALDDAVLRARADAALTNAAVAVTEKRMVPEGGDRHDYMSFGPYWWPDPSKPDGLPFIRRDGEVNPSSLVDSDRVRLERVCSDVAVLAAACRRLDDRAAGAEAARKLRRFFLDPETAMRPHLNYGQAIPGICKGRGIGIIETRLLAETMVDAILILREQKALSAADDEGLVKWFADYLDWLVTSPIGKDEADQLNNHGTAYDLQVAVFALFTGRRQLARETLERAPSARIDVQVEPDGRQPREIARTCSLGYSTMNAALLCELASVADLVGVDLWGYVSKDGRSIRKAVEFLMPYWRQEKPWPYRQIKNFRFEPDAYRVPLAIYNRMSERKLSVELARDELSLHLAIDGASVWTQDGRPVEIVLGKAPDSAAAAAPFTSYGRLVGSRLYLWGDDGGKKPRYGTLFALYGFLEEVGGFRWPRPGDKAIRSAGRKRIVIPKAWAYSFAPPLMFTRLRNPKVDSLIERSRQRDPANPLTAADAERIRAENERWFLRMRHQTREKVPHGHAFTTWQDRFLGAHPDWFALGKDGKRGNPAKRADRVKLCLSNPEVVAAIVEEWKSQGTGKYLNVAPNDSAGYCRCESCVKMAEPLSDRYVLFWNKIAAAARKVRPDVKIVTYLYSDYRLPPEKARFAYPESMICGIVPHLDDDPKSYLSGWKKAGLKSFFFRPNYLGPKALEPMHIERRVYDDLRLYLENGMIGADYDAHTGDPAVARELYVAARLLAFPDLTFDRLMQELADQ